MIIKRIKLFFHCLIHLHQGAIQTVPKKDCWCHTCEPNRINN